MEAEISLLMANQTLESHDSLLKVA